MSRCSCQFDGINAMIPDPLCTVHGTGTQPLPVMSGAPIAHRLVQDDIEQRLQFGISKYGMGLQPHNGRDSLRDAYEEILDAACYLRNLMYERDGK